eukprot:COSAG06_NODE_10019_length_1767_cov_1.426859_3_plen_97_part_00
MQTRGKPLAPAYKLPRHATARRDDATRTAFSALQPTAVMQVQAGGFGAPEWGVRALGPLRHSVDTIIIVTRGAGTTSRGRRGATAAEPAATIARSA